MDDADTNAADADNADANANNAEANADNAKDGDVVMCMGAGSIGAVPGKVVDMLQNSELKALKGSAV